MDRSLKTILLLGPCLTFFGCSNILQSVDLSINVKDKAAQEDFNVIEKTLTLAEANAQRAAPYTRVVSREGTGSNANIVSESLALKSEFPAQNELSVYKLGVGDQLIFSRLIENASKENDVISTWPKSIDDFEYKLGIGDELRILQIVEEEKQQQRSVGVAGSDDAIPNFTTEETVQNIIESDGRVGSDGSVLLLEIGRLDAEGKTLNELRSEVRNILIRNGSSPRFQLEIAKFRSQRAYLTINNTSSVITLNDQKTTLLDILSSAGKGLEIGMATNVKLQRGDKKFNMGLRKIFSNDAPNIQIKDKDHIFVEDVTSRVSQTTAVVGEDGYVVIAGVGKISALNRSLAEIRNEVELRMNKVPNSENAFQVEISQFNSKQALINIPGEAGGIVSITNKNTPLETVLSQNGVAVNGKEIKRVRLKRSGKTYYFTFADLITKNAEPIFLQPNDRVSLEILKYKPNKIFILGGITPKILNIEPAIRETLADVLFTAGGVLSSTGAMRSEVYLLRGKNPVTAYHLDAQSPTRLIVADAMELRPNDILFVSEQPIVSFNRSLATITPLRILLSDIEDGAIP